MRRLEYDTSKGDGQVFEWNGKIVIGRWRWFWKRIQFWHYVVLKIRVPNGSGRTVKVIKMLWRYR
jgi:hypothetical protein